MKKKLIRVTTVPYSLGGLLRGQLKYMSAYFEVVGIASSGEGHLDKVGLQEGIRTIPVEMTRKITPFKDLKALWKLYRIFRKEKPFFVHTHTPKAGLLGMIASYLARVPHRLHDIAGLPLVEATGLKLVVLKMVEKLTYGCASRVYPNSRGMHKMVLDNKFAPPAKFKVLDKISSNGVNTSHFNPALLEESELMKLRKSLDIVPDDFVCIFVGRLVKDKGVNELVAVFELLSIKYKHLKLLMLGSYENHLDPLDKKTENIIQNNTALKYVGSQADVRPYMAISDILVFPSYREGFPNVPMEAGAMGLPAVVSDINGCNEIIEHGRNGLIVPLKDEVALGQAIEKLMKDRELLNSMATNARPMVITRYEQESIWKEILKEYKRLEANDL